MQKKRTQNKWKKKIQANHRIQFTIHNALKCERKKIGKIKKIASFLSFVMWYKLYRFLTFTAFRNRVRIPWFHNFIQGLFIVCYLLRHHSIFCSNYFQLVRWFVELASLADFLNTKKIRLFVWTVNIKTVQIVWCSIFRLIPLIFTAWSEWESKRKLERWFSLVERVYPEMCCSTAATTATTQY